MARNIQQLIFCMTIASLTSPMLPADASAAAKGTKAKRRVVAVFPILARDDANPATVDSVSTLLDNGSVLIASVELVTTQTLRKRLGKEPGKMIELCGSNLKCIAKLGKKVKANEVLLGRAVPEGGGVKISFLVIDVKKQTVVRKQSLVFASMADVKPVLGGTFFALFDVTQPGYLKLASVGANSAVLVDGKAVGKGAGPHTLPPGMHSVTVDGTTKTVMLPPFKLKTVDFAVAGNADDFSTDSP
jgi:hypothetical protein